MACWIAFKLTLCIYFVGYYGASYLAGKGCFRLAERRAFALLWPFWATRAMYRKVCEVSLSVAAGFKSLYRGM